MLLTSSSSAPSAPPAAALRKRSTPPTTANLATAALLASPRLRCSSALCRASEKLHPARSIEIRPFSRAAQRLGLDRPRGINVDLSCRSSSSVAAAAAAASSSTPVASPGQTRVAFLGMGIMGVAMVRFDFEKKVFEKSQLSRGSLESGRRRRPRA